MSRFVSALIKLSHKRSTEILISARRRRHRHEIGHFLVTTSNEKRRDSNVNEWKSYKLHLPTLWKLGGKPSINIFLDRPCGTSISTIRPLIEIVIHGRQIQSLILPDKLVGRCLPLLICRAWLIRLGVALPFSVVTQWLHQCMVLLKHLYLIIDYR